MDINKLLSDSIIAIENEIEAVRLKPQREILFSIPNALKTVEPPSYTFKTSSQAFQYVSELILVSTYPNIRGEVISCDEDKVTIRFDKTLTEPVLEIEVEWVNDFILSRILNHLEFIQSEESEKRKRRISDLFTIHQQDNWENSKIYEDGFRNIPQVESIKKSITNRVTYIWGPPGTGKTATLGFIIANLLKQGKSVLFVSNTNRAVDVGLLSLNSALDFVYPSFDRSNLCRFGESAIKDDWLESVSFDNQIEVKRNEIKSSFLPGKDDIRRQFLLHTINKLIASGKKVPPKLEYELELLGSESELVSSESALEEQLEMLAAKEIYSKKLVATTLARVCTSDLLMGLSFDAVVIDEASMASIPYLLVMASKSKKHFIVAGDPMQLPPISTTSNKIHSNFLEKDVYSLVSNATSMDELFSWKDKNHEITCFFDTQYRLNEDLASIISDVFYNGRLRTDKKPNFPKPLDGDLSIFIVDSSKHGAFLKVDSTDRGFKPINEVNMELTIELIRRLIFREGHHPSQIGVIVPFRNVVWSYKKALREAGIYDVEAGTIHTFQGREKEAILFDSVMSGLGHGNLKKHFPVRPFDETKNGLSVHRLLNVALSRAKDKLIIIADIIHINTVYNDMFLGELIHRIRQHERKKNTLHT